jgi:hypothetical protein
MDAYNATAPNRTGARSYGIPPPDFLEPMTGARSYGLPPDLIEYAKKRNVIEAIGIVTCILTLLAITILVRKILYSHMTRRGANTVPYGAKHTDTDLFQLLRGNNDQEKQYSPRTFPTATTTTTTTANRPSNPFNSQSDIKLQSITLA